MKTFKDYLTEGPGDDPDWMKKWANPDNLSIGDKASSENLYGSGTSGKYDMPSEKFRSAQAKRMKVASDQLKQGYDQGPAINDIKVVVERLQKLEAELDGLAGEANDMQPDEVAREVDGIRERVSAMTKTLNKAWHHLAVGGKPYR